MSKIERKKLHDDDDIYFVVVAIVGHSSKQFIFVVILVALSEAIVTACYKDTNTNNRNKSARSIIPLLM